MAINRELLAQAEWPTRADRVVLDMDSSESPVHGLFEDRLRRIRARPLPAE